MKYLQFQIFLLCVTSIFTTDVDDTPPEFEFDDPLIEFVNTFNNRMSYACNSTTIATVDYFNDVQNEEKFKKYVNILVQMYGARMQFYERSEKLFSEPFVKYSTMYEQFKKVSLYLPPYPTDMAQIFGNRTDILKKYSLAKICPFGYTQCEITKKGLGRLELQYKLERSTNYDELLYIWKSWRHVTGSELKPIYKKLYDVERIYGFNVSVNDPALMLRYDFGEVIDDAMKLWDAVKPLYTELHKFVLKKLKSYYGYKIDIRDKMIPDHLLDSIWSTGWYRLEPIVRPFQFMHDGNLDDNMQSSMNPSSMFQEANKFLMSFGLSDISEAYEGIGARIERPTGRQSSVCLPKSYNYCNGTYRVNMCAIPNLENFIEVFHQLGKIHYFELSEHLSYVDRGSSIFFLPETIGEVFAISATSQDNLRRLKVLTNYEDSYEANINYLMKMALIKITFIPSALAVALWKRDIYSGDVPYSKWNSRFWKYKKDIAKIKPPIARTNDDFDPGAVAFVATSQQYIPYIFAHFVQYQVYRQLCIDSKKYNENFKEFCPLHKCNFYKSTKVGNRVRKVLGFDNTVPWQRVLKELSEQEKYSADAILEYFQPLYEYLKKENEEVRHVVVAPSYPVNLMIMDLFLVFMVTLILSTIVFFNRVCISNAFRQII